MMERRARRLLGGLVAAALVTTLAACGGDDADAPEDSGVSTDAGTARPDAGAPDEDAGPPASFSYTIGGDVEPVRDSSMRPDDVRRDIGALEDAEGVVSSFVVGEVLVESTDEAVLEDFLDRTGGEVISDNGVPTPPEGLDVELGPGDTEPTTHVVAVDTSDFPLDDLERDLESLIEADREARISSEEAARHLAFVAAEEAAGSPVTLNFVGAGTQAPMLLGNTRESATGFTDALSYDRFDSEGSRASVDRALQYLVAHGDYEQVKIAIIDGGFFVDGDGRPRDPAPDGTHDYRISDTIGRADAPLQYDFDDDDRVAEGENLNSCTGGSDCPWHGHNAAMASTAIVDNGFGTAGTGGLVGLPMLFKVQLDIGQVERAVRTAESWEADVISMSFSFNCGNVFCERHLERRAFHGEMQNARDAGIVLLAAAGNDSEPMNVKTVHNDVYPCSYTETMCVGALADGTSDRIGYSNAGDRVDIWAPTNVPVFKPNNRDILTLTTFGGTSSSTPFVAGVVAMMKSLDAGLDPPSIRDTIGGTAWTDSTDPWVDRTIDAFHAVRAAAGRDLPPDPEEPNDLDTEATPIALDPGANDLGVFTFTTLDDTDVLAFDVADYTDLVVTGDYLDSLSDLRILLIQTTPGLPPERTPSSGTTLDDLDRREIEYRNLEPGSYLLRMDVPDVEDRDVEGPYRLAIDRSAGAGIFADGFEDNETMGTAWRFGDARGTYEATHHVAGDVDYYEVDVSPSPGLDRFELVVRGSTYPIEISVYDDSGTYLDSTTDGSIAIASPGTYRVSMVPGPSSGDGIGRYVFTTAGAHLDESSEIPAGFRDGPGSDFWRIPWREMAWVDWSVLGGAEYFVVPPDVPGDTIRSEGVVHLRLYDDAGTLVGEGVRMMGDQGPYELLSLGDIGSGEGGVLEVVATTRSPELLGGLSLDPDRLASEPFQMRLE